MTSRTSVVLASALFAIAAIGTIAALTNASVPANAGIYDTPTTTPCPIHTVPDPEGEGCIKVTQTMTPTPIPCPTGTVYDPYLLACVPITPTATPCPPDYEVGPEGTCVLGTPPGFPTHTPTACPTHQFPVQGQCATITPTHVPCPTDMIYDPFLAMCVPNFPTPCPTHSVPTQGACATITPTPTSVRPANFSLTFTANGSDSTTVGLRALVNLSWNVVNLANWPLHVSVDADQMDELDKTCERISSGGTCGADAGGGFAVAGTYTVTVRATGYPAPPCAGCPSLELQRSVTVLVESVGDFNCDSRIDSIDAALILQIEAGMAVPLPCTGDGDVDHDGELNALDALLILQFNAHLITAFP